MTRTFSSALLLSAVLLAGCSGTEQPATEAVATEKATASALPADARIVSLNGTLTEILASAGYEQNIAGTDVTSTYPASIAQVPKVGHTRTLQAEGILGLQPQYVVAKREELNPDLQQQLQAAGVKLLLVDQEYSAEGTKKLIQTLCDTLGRPEKGLAMTQQLEQDLQKIEPLNPKPKVLFIYARGAGTLMVAGEGTPMQTMIEMAGGENAAKGFTEFKPLTPEALLQANPDAILLFDSGLQSLQGNEGLLQVPGLANTKAGRNKAFISMDGQYLSGFGPRTGQAAAELNQKLKSLPKVD